MTTRKQVYATKFSEVVDDIELGFHRYYVYKVGDDGFSELVLPRGFNGQFPNIDGYFATERGAIAAANRVGK